MSISGSESDTDEDYEDEMNELSISILKEDVVEGTKYRDDRQPKFYFKNGNDEIISIYKKVLFNNQVKQLLYFSLELSIRELFIYSWQLNLGLLYSYHVFISLKFILTLRSYRCFLVQMTESAEFVEEYFVFCMFFVLVSNLFIYLD